MRLLHISDLHAGKKLYDRVSRKEDLLYALKQIKDICRENRVEVLLIAGDVFDKRIPDFESQEIIMDFLTEMNALGLHIVMVAGNHDSYDFMKIYRILRRLANIHVFDRPLMNVSDMVFSYGPLKVACLPYPDERAITHFDEEKHRSYAEKVARYMTALAKQVEDAPYRVLLAHLMVDRAQIAGSELQASVSPYYAVKAETIPDTFQYVALGHVHRNQRIEGLATKVYYAGSLYQIDFSEKGMDKFVNMVVFEDGMAKVEPIKLDLKRELVEVTLREGQDIKKELEHIARQSVLVKVCLQVKMGDPSLSMKKELISKLLGDKLAKIELEPVGSSEEVSRGEEKLDLISLYEEFYRNKYQSAPPEELKALLEKLISVASHETHKA